MPKLKLNFKFYRLIPSKGTLDGARLFRQIKGKNVDDKTKKVKSCEYYRMGQLRRGTGQDRDFIMFGDFVRIIKNKAAYKGSITDEKIKTWVMNTDEGLLTSAPFAFDSQRNILTLLSGHGVPTRSGIIGYLNKFTPGYDICAHTIPTSETLESIRDGSVYSLQARFAPGTQARLKPNTTKAIRELVGFQSELGNCIVEIKIRPEQGSWRSSKIWAVLKDILGLSEDDDKKVAVFRARAAQEAEGTGRLLNFLDGDLQHQIILDTADINPERAELQNAAYRAWADKQEEIASIIDQEE